MKFFGFWFNKPKAPAKNENEVNKHASSAKQSDPDAKLSNTEIKNNSQRLVDSVLHLHSKNKLK